MKGKDREVYLELVDAVGYDLCSFCKSAYFVSCCDGSECHHPLDNIPGHDHALDPGEDCWGFRPSHSVSVCADIVGIILEKGWDGGATWEIGENGIGTISGYSTHKKKS
jgi:hypothetical protein